MPQTPISVFTDLCGDLGVGLLRGAEGGDGVSEVLEELHLALREQQAVLVVLHLQN